MPSPRRSLIEPRRRTGAASALPIPRDPLLEISEDTDDRDMRHVDVEAVVAEESLREEERLLS